MTTTASPPPPTTTAAVRIRALRRTYGGVAALDGVDLDVLPGTFTAVMGPSGSGKSTLLQCAAGLDRPTSGTVEVGGTELTGLSERRLTLLRRDRIGFVFQSFNLVPSLTAAQNVALPLRLAGRRPSRAQVRDALAAVGLDGRARHLPSQLSGGQQQRAALARALITRPAVLFGDEPTGALDTTAGRAVLVMLRDLVDREGLTVVMVTHDPAAASYADRVVFLVDGRLVGGLASPSAGQVAAAMTDLETAEPTPGRGPGPASAGDGGGGGSGGEDGPRLGGGRRPPAAAARAPGSPRHHTSGGFTW
ncbi:ABC transporter ATP-binding protein [Streptomyces sp. NPDC019208]|uniref:ABC transporter ATP-binding protein n=1 Tax=Streptomyces sp. NPDC019208 TaxID=3154683 RepID=UPI003406CDAE